MRRRPCASLVQNWAYQNENPAELARRGVFHLLSDEVLLPATAATAAATAGTAATAAATATLAFLRFIDTERATTHILAVQGLDGALRIAARHLDEAEAAGTAGFAIVDQGHRLHGAVLLEECTDVGFGSAERQIPNIDFRHKSQVSL